MKTKTKEKIYTTPLVFPLLGTEAEEKPLE
jgi:hypothetical protein